LSSPDSEAQPFADRQAVEIGRIDAAKSDALNNPAANSR
jgi:hypothetical protein